MKYHFIPGFSLGTVATPHRVTLGDPCLSTAGYLAESLALPIRSQEHPPPSMPDNYKSKTSPDFARRPLGGTKSLQVGRHRRSRFRLAKVYKLDYTWCWQGCSAKRTLSFVANKNMLLQLLQKTTGQCLLNKECIHPDPATLLLGIKSIKMKQTIPRHRL